MLHLIEEHRSPDGLLMFKVEREDDSDYCLGFDGYPWHTHADILASSLGIGETDAVRQFVDDLVGGRAIIGVARVGGEIRDVWVADEPVPDKYKPEMRRLSLDIGMENLSPTNVTPIAYSDPRLLGDTHSFHSPLLSFSIGLHRG